jgi:alpha-beta hydrolase superfamily lysophospholipase
MHSLQTHDGLHLHAHHWPTHHAQRGTVVLSHGLGEHLGRYTHVAAFLNELGWAVRGYDHRGHGLSEGKRGDIARIDSLLSDLGLFLHRLRQLEPDQPLLLLGHSMGAMVTARYVAEGLMPRPAPWYQPVAGLVLSSPPIDMGLKWSQRVLLATMPHVLPHLCVGNGLQPEWVCNAPDVVAAYRQDALVHDRISSLLARFAQLSGQTVMSLAPKWCTPTLLMWAGADRCLDPLGTARFAEALPKFCVESRVFQAMGHEIFNEVGNETVLSKLGAWLARHH